MCLFFSVHVLVDLYGYASAYCVCTDTRYGLRYKAKKILLPFEHKNDGKNEGGGWTRREIDSSMSLPFPCHGKRAAADTGKDKAGALQTSLSASFALAVSLSLSTDSEMFSSL